jgi:hypothetical protein
MLFFFTERCYNVDMAKSVFEEEALRATRSRLDVKDEEEAKFMMKVLGGEVGEVRSNKPEAPHGRDGWNRSYTKSTPLRRVETVGLPEKDTDSHGSRSIPRFSPGELTYRERIKMDSQEANAEFKIKTWGQLFRSKLSFFNRPPDTVNRVFVAIKMDDYFLPLKKLVNKVRLIFPRNNATRSKKLKKDHSFAFSVLDTIRYWNIEKISSSLMRLQSHPRAVVIPDFVEIIKEFYRPLIILEMLDPEIHLVKAVNDLEHTLEDDFDSQINHKTADEIVASFNEVNEDTRYRLYPFLLKFTSKIYVPYGNFFSDCEQEIRAFLGIAPEDIVQPTGDTDSPDEQTAQDGEAEDFGDDAFFGLSTANEKPAQQVSRNGKPRAIQRGLDVLEQLFPEAGWEELDTFPDIYHYFAKSLSLKKNADVIDPENPMLQALVLMQILDELFYGFRSIAFNEVGFDLSEFLGIIDEWHKLIESCFERVYLPRLAEFVKLFYNPLEPKQRSYARKLREELNWVARLYLFPSLKIDSMSQALVHKKDVTAVFPKIRILRQDFTIIAGEIEKAMQAGGAFVQAYCAAIDNPWDPYVFQVANPLSKRLDLLFGKEDRTNVSLIYYTLSVLAVLDFFVNNPNSWAYKTNTEKLFRSSDSAGLVPQSLPENSVNADAIFKRKIEKLKAHKAQNNEKPSHN